MPGRTQHPSDAMLDHARREQHLADLKVAVERLTSEILDRQRQRATIRRTILQLSRRGARVA